MATTSRPTSALPAASSPNMSSSQGLERALKSFVIISATNDSKAFCSGCVLRKSPYGVLVVCPGKFIQGRELVLQVWFYDGQQLEANVYTEHGDFCLLFTARHETCVGITWSEESLNPGTLSIFVPISSEGYETKDAYLASETTQAYLCNAVDVMETNSDDYFMVLCNYYKQDVEPAAGIGGLLADADDAGGCDRLAAAPVFEILSGNAVGIVLQKCRFKGQGIEMKVVMKASVVKRLLDLRGLV